MINDVIKELESNKDRRERGDLIAIPWSTLQRLNEVLPGVQQGKYYLIAARPKAGKTQIADYLFMYEVFDWWYKNRDSTNIDIKIDYFSLEMSSKLKWISAISYKLFTSYGILISPQNLRSVFGKYILGEEIIQIIKSPKFQHWLKLFQEKVNFYDTIRNPWGIYKKVKDDKETTGTWDHKIIKWQNEDGSFIDRKVKGKYTPNNPNLYHIVITDHLGLLSTEKGETTYQSIQKFSSEYCINMRDAYNITNINVQQMSADSATAEYTGGGKLILDKVRPTDSDLSDNKHTAMDVNIMLSLFWPYKYGVKDYEGWDLARMGMNHRELILNLNRDGISQASIQLAFLGQCNYFTELPKEPSEAIYAKIDKWNKSTI